MNRQTVLGLFLVGLLVALGGCSSSVTKPNWTAEEQKAVDLSQAFLAKQGTNWGNPSTVKRTEVEYLKRQPGEVLYLVNYATPADEIKVVGERSVVVDIAHKRADYVPRD